MSPGKISAGIMKTVAPDFCVAAVIASTFFLKPRNQKSFPHLATHPLLFMNPHRLCLTAFQPTPPPLPPLSSLLVNEGSGRRPFLSTLSMRSAAFDLLNEVSRSGSCPIHILESDGDWSFERLQTIVAFLVDVGRTTEALQVFCLWKNKDKSRSSTVNYSKILQLFCKRSLMNEAMLIIEDMEKHKVAQSIEIYNDIIHGFARIKEFEKCRTILMKMVENGISPVHETYNVLIRAHGSYGFYDDMSRCVKLMESSGCSPNEATYNVLIQEFARGGLLERMEKVYRTLLSKRMHLYSSTLVTMIEAYAEFRILDKLEKMYCKFLNSKAYMKDCLIRKIANVYIENCRFARLEEFGNDIGGRTGRSELIWCILLLSSAGLLSRKGINSIAREMEIAKVRLSTSLANIFALFYLKMNDFRALNGIFSDAIKDDAQPDVLTVSILFDACTIGYDGAYVLEKWNRKGFLEAVVEMKTDPLVISTFGKGPFMRRCEKLCTSRESKAKEKKLWRYADLMRLVLCK
ncbi:hypothetical protein HPP92_007232 [Vanilla planifolia]|uniref:Pentatricopeptide repeat-containing protein n=1 Tax=Vanilla planifolia TaxID=51239 RepID=A0A835R9R9_VANPL|nr:hypothetical protein HPP92_007232 [Vanilla planifolia]